MKYMTFQNSCSFCCLANMLEKYGLDISDRQILLDADLPYIFRYDSASDAFLTGAMLQTEADYNRALRQYGFLFVDTLVRKEALTTFLSTHVPCMIGLSAENGGKHAMVLTRTENDTFYFLNPHREHDEEPDEIALTTADLSTRVDEESHVGYLKQVDNKDRPQSENLRDSAPAELSKSLQALALYEERMTAFCQDLPSLAEILTVRDSLLRPIALDLPVMMGLIGETDLHSRPLLFQKQIFALFRPDEGKAPQAPDLVLFCEILEDYKKLLNSQAK
ncbi:MAG: hypothetical protein LUI10_09675 [Lachnospiraceae bacterium]|nr:hypothetical protein [Lachnospiraceae bacterium]